MGFQRATKRQSRLRLALIGPSGSGKTYTALNVAQHLGEKVAVVDTERGSASKYADLFGFDTMELASFHPQQYMDAIHEADADGYDVLIIDSLSHAWMGKDGALELVDRAAKRSQSQNTFAAWREVTPLHNQLVDAMLQARCHIIVTMRAKTEYVLETNEKGRQVPRKVGMAPVQRDGLEYEFDVVADMDLDNNLIVSKTRCSALRGALINRPGKDVADVLNAWLTDGAPAVELPPVITQQQAQPSVTRPGSQAPTSPRSVGAPAGQSASRPISEAQQKRLFAILAGEGKRIPEELKLYLAANHNYHTTPDAKASAKIQGGAEYDGIVKWAGTPGSDEPIGEKAAEWLDAAILASNLTDQQYASITEEAGTAPFANTAEWSWKEAGRVYAAIEKARQTVGATA